MNIQLLRILTTYTRTHFTLPLAHVFIRQPDTIQFLAAYPRSGSTWLRTMVCNVLVPTANSDPIAFNREIPGVSLKNLPLINEQRPTRYVFTHARYLSSVKKCLYIVRDGRDAIVSYYHFTTTRRGTEIPFGEWLNYYFAGYYGPRWDQNVLSWLEYGKRELGSNLKVVRFEDLKKNATQELAGILKFLDIPFDFVEVENAIQQASLEKERQWETHYLGHIQDANASFYRGGKTGGGQDYMDSDMYRRFIHVSKRAFEIAGYSL